MIFLEKIDFRQFAQIGAEKHSDIPMSFVQAAQRIDLDGRGKE